MRAYFSCVCEHLESSAFLFCGVILTGPFNADGMMTVLGSVTLDTKSDLFFFGLATTSMVDFTIPCCFLVSGSCECTAEEMNNDVTLISSTASKFWNVHHLCFHTQMCMDHAYHSQRTDTLFIVLDLEGPLISRSRK
ncbi:hypothetical protein BDB00DRAFT_805082 [Zychaea mexicana]|uniref:uncharacterized protein n=1 Tax=Zychaea mexicana TaxID=64656 RepID=UPI0022FE5859|nr:uncharacterized protein BDB00DRAFT_805082 [Zychaea mexicana]KAI9497122.1 hypothetical protein BDB00DRAFT_805082 [Zychaea mexicana]